MRDVLLLQKFYQVREFRIWQKDNLLFQQTLFTGVILINNRQESLSCNRFELFNPIDSKYYIVENSISMPQSVTLWCTSGAHFRSKFCFLLILMTSLNVCNLPHDLEWINECRHKNLQWDQNIDKVRYKISRVISGLRQARDYVTLFKCTKKYIALKSMPVLKQKPKGHLLTKPLHDHFSGLWHDNRLSL